MEKDIALIIIDIQVGVFDGSAIPSVSAADKLLSNISQLIEKARQAAIPIIFVQHNGVNGHPLERETKRWDFHPKLDVTDKDLIVQKSTPDSFYDTDLQEILRSNKIRKVVIAGIQTEFCIDTTCRRAFGMGYEVTLVKDAHSTWDTNHLSASQIIDHHNYLLNEWFVSLKGVSEINFISEIGHDS